MPPDPMLVLKKLRGTSALELFCQPKLVLQIVSTSHLLVTTDLGSSSVGEAFFYNLIYKCKSIIGDFWRWLPLTCRYSWLYVRLWTQLKQTFPLNRIWQNWRDATFMVELENYSFMSLPSWKLVTALWVVLQRELCANELMANSSEISSDEWRPSFNWSGWTRSGQVPVRGVGGWPSPGKNAAACSPCEHLTAWMNPKTRWPTFVFPDYCVG